MPIYRVVRQDEMGHAVTTDYPDQASFLLEHEQVGVESDTYNLRLHQQPIVKGLIGPLAEGRRVIRYEDPFVYAKMTETWAKPTRSYPSDVP